MNWYVYFSCLFRILYQYRESGGETLIFILFAVEKYKKCSFGRSKIDYLQSIKCNMSFLWVNAINGPYWPCNKSIINVDRWQWSTGQQYFAGKSIFVRDK